MLRTWSLPSFLHDCLFEVFPRNSTMLQSSLRCGGISSPPSLLLDGLFEMGLRNSTRLQTFSSRCDRYDLNSSCNCCLDIGLSNLPVSSNLSEEAPACLETSFRCDEEDVFAITRFSSFGLLSEASLLAVTADDPPRRQDRILFLKL